MIAASKAVIKAKNTCLLRHLLLISLLVLLLAISHRMAFDGRLSLIGLMCLRCSSLGGLALAALALLLGGQGEELLGSAGPGGAGYHLCACRRQNQTPVLPS